jgi:hypothetical protein
MVADTLMGAGGTPPVTPPDDNTGKAGIVAPDPKPGSAAEPPATPTDADKQAAADQVVADAVAKFTPEEKTAYDALTPEQKTVKDAELQEAAKAAAKPAGAPEKYADFVMPEGMTMDKEVGEQFAVTAKDLGLSQEQAQKLVDLQAGLVKKQAAAAKEAAQAGFDKTTQEWKDETVKELGADHAAKIAIASKAVTQFGTPALRDTLNTTGLGNHPELVKFFYKIGLAISEDALIHGKSGTGGSEKSTAETLYPSQK